MDSRKTRQGLLVLAATFTAVALSACGTGGPDGTKAEGSSAAVVIGQPNEPRSLEAGFSTSQAEINIGEQFNEKLIEFTPDGGDYEPRLATEWEIIEPGVLQVVLREGVKFTNGEDFNADGVVFSAEAMLENNDFDDYTAVLTDYTVVDEHKVEVRFEGTPSQALTALALSSFQYPKEYFTEVGKDGFGSSPVGTGPFIFDRWEKGVSVKMTANPNYWGGAPKASGIEYRFFADTSAGLNALQGGTVHLLTQPPIGSLPVLEDTEGLELVSTAGGRLWAINFSRWSENPLTDPKVGIALQHAVDTESIIRNQRAGFARSASGQYAPDNAIGFHPDIQQREYDPKLAKKLLAEAGYPDGFSINFQYAARDTEVAQAVASMFEAVGVTVTQEALEVGTYLTKMGPPMELNDMWLGGSLTPPDAAQHLNAYTCDFWYGYYCDEEYDSLWAKIAAERDDDSRVQLLQEGAMFLHENPAGIPLYVADDLYGASSKLRGFTPRSTQFIDARELSLAE